MKEVIFSLPPGSVMSLFSDCISYAVHIEARVSFIDKVCSIDEIASTRSVQQVKLRYF